MASFFPPREQTLTPEQARDEKEFVEFSTALFRKAIIRTLNRQPRDVRRASKRYIRHRWALQDRGEA